MKTSFLDYYKMILEKVSFDQNLLVKEYKKAKNTLTQYETLMLDEWLQNSGLPIRASIQQRELVHQD